MNFRRSLALTLPLATLAAALLLPSSDARACGGCFVPSSADTQVTGHRMVLSVSPEATTLYDQFEYAGAPESFAWVLPIKGQVEVGLSADGLFTYLNDDTASVVLPPPLNCPPPPSSCVGGEVASTGAIASGGAVEDGGVTVITQEVVGPYETVQLASEDPEALRTWLADHDYQVPDDIAPIVSAYVEEGFNFLAMKLMPGEGVSSMRPVRVTTPGAGIGLPLRMVAAGTGAVTKVTLWVLGQGRYEASNFDTVNVDPSEVVWNWDTGSSNLAELEADALATKDGFAWLTQAALPYSPYELASKLQGLSAMVTPEALGYLGDAANGVTPQQEVENDLAHLFGTMPSNEVWVTRLHAQLPRLALATDLTVAASEDQNPVDRVIQTTRAIGQAPVCDDYSWCDDGSATTSSANGSGDGSGEAEDGGLGFQGQSDKGSGVLSDESDSACSAAPAQGSGSWSKGALLALGLAGLGMVRRRRHA